MGGEILPAPAKDSEAAQLAAADELVRGQSIWVLKTADGFMRGEILNACSIEYNGLEVRSDCGRRLRISTLGRSWRFEFSDIELPLKTLTHKIVKGRLSTHHKELRANSKMNSFYSTRTIRTPSGAAVTGHARSLVWNPKKPKPVEPVPEAERKQSVNTGSATLSRAKLGWSRIRLEFLGGREGSMQPVTGPQSGESDAASTAFGGRGSQRSSSKRRASEDKQTKQTSEDRIRQQREAAEILAVEREAIRKEEMENAEMRNVDEKQNVVQRAAKSFGTAKRSQTVDSTSSAS